MKPKKSLDRTLFLLLLPFWISCQSCKEGLDTGPVTREEMQFTAEAWTAAAPSGKLDLRVCWKNSDRISVFSDKAQHLNEEFKNSSQDKEKAVFEGEAAPASQYTAISPYKENTKVSGEKIIAELPAEQRIRTDSPFTDAGIAVALSEDGAFGFRNACAVLAFEIPDISGLESITIKGNNREKIAGTAEILLNAQSFISKASHNASEEILIKGDFEKGKICYVPFIPATFRQGLTVTFIDSYARTYTLTEKKSLVTSAGKLVNMTDTVLEPGQIRVSLPRFRVELNETEVIRPGLMLSRINLTTPEGKPLHTFLYEVDLNQKDLSITQTTPYAEELGSGLQSITGQALAADSPSDRILGGTNSDFFDMRNGTNLPHGVFHHDGVCYKDFFNPNITSRKMSFFYITKDGQTGIAAEEEYKNISRSLDLKEVCGGGDILVRAGTALKYSNTLEPRTCIGISRDGKKVYIMVADGRREGYSVGISLTNLAIYMQSIGAWTAMNLDGGGSSGIYLRNPDKGDQDKSRFEIQNRPSDDRERSVASSLVITEHTTQH